jgi:hypothetical protein
VASTRQDVFEYLQSIDVEDLPGACGFRLLFKFAVNPYFTNSVLSKEYRIANPYGNDTMLEKAVG